jgi:ubiquinone/menaquinone biosynthesis C-methylase UbiE
MRVEMARGVAAAIAQHVPVSAETDVLDYGAGTGLVTLALQPLVRSITAADSSQGMLARLGEKIATSHIGNVKTILLDLESDPAPEQRFDLVISTMTMHHVEDTRALIRSFHEMLRTGGYLAIADLDLDGGEFHSDPTGVKHDGFDRREIERFYTEAGFSQVKIVTAHTLSRAVQGDEQREFSIFVAVGRKSLQV